jgi:nitrogen regulatory protein P-II 1
MPTFLGWEGAMGFKQVTAILRNELLDDVLEELKKIGVKGLTVTSVKGYGESKHIWAKHWFVSHARVEIITEKTKADEIVAAIMEIAHTGGPGDGIVCILPVEKVFRIRTRSEARPDEI